MAEVTDGLKVQAAIDACYLWRGHVMKPEQVAPFLAAHGLYVKDDKIGMAGVFGQDGAPFWIVSAIESPYGLEIDDL
tara:strand:+ start:1638 stop:1868 length:231 start_codon:yes stop_codon:yes gene_type:complete